MRPKIRYDTIEKFTVNRKPDECDLAHETKTNKHQCPVQFRFEIREGSQKGIRVTIRITEERICKTDEF